MKEKITYKANFDWEMTKRKLVVFMPNYKYHELTEFTISQIQTVADINDWIIIIGNDGVDKNWEHLVENNVRYFTLMRGNSDRRNPGFIRNYAIKRCQSELFFVKDGEVVVLGDFIYNNIWYQMPWKAGKISVLDEKQTNDYMINPKSFKLDITATTKVMIAENAIHVKNIILEADGRINSSTYFSYAYSIRTSVLKEMRGYDEDYVASDWEDSDIFCRLFHLKYFLVPDYACIAVHLYHPRNHAKEGVLNMRNIFESKNPEISIRNSEERWGEGC